MLRRKTTYPDNRPDWQRNPHLYRESGSRRLPLAIIHQHFAFSEDKSSVVWKKSNPNHALHGKQAGTIHRDKKRNYVNGIFIRFKKGTILAEDIAFALANGKHVETGHKIIHKDGNRLNNHPSNLMEVAQVKGDPYTPEEKHFGPRH